MPHVATLPNTLKLLGEPTRLRLVGLVALEELSVQELVTITGYPQSRTSNHLALLKRSGLVSDRREGAWSFYRLVEPSASGPLTPQLYAATVQPWLDSGLGQDDLAAVEAVREQRRERSRSTHDRLARSWERAALDGGAVRAEAWGALVPERLVVADLGCGNGFLAEYLVARGARVIGIDHSPAMLEESKRRVPRGAEFRTGELDALPLADGEADAAFCNLVWHHVADADRAAREVSRVLKPGGRIVITDYLPHEAEWMREAMGDLRLGLDPVQVTATLARAGFDGLVSRDLGEQQVPGGRQGKPVSLPMFLVRGSKPVSAEAGSPPRKQRITKPTQKPKQPK